MRSAKSRWGGGSVERIVTHCRADARNWIALFGGLTGERAA